MTPTDAIGEDVRLWRGDALDVLPELDGPFFVLTDPPYGIALESHGTTFRGIAPIAGDESGEAGAAVIRLCESRGWPVLAFADPDKPWPGRWRQRLVWDKGPAVGIGGDRKTCWKQTWELIQVGKFPEVFGSRESAVITCWVTPENSADHPAAKPLKLMRYLVRKLVPAGGVVLDPFMGSGRTLVAAIQEGRKAVGIELDQAHYQTALSRLRHAAGESPDQLFGVLGDRS